MTAEDSKQIEATIKKERGRLFNFIRRNVPTREEAEDILQDVLFQFVSGFEEIEFVDRISGWLMCVAKNKIIDSQRKKKPQAFRDVKIRIPGDESGDSLSLEDIIPDFSGLPDEVYWQNQSWDEIEDALDELPDEQREVFEMNEFEGMSFKEISEIKDEPINTLLSRKRYAVLFLRKRLKNLYEELKNNV
ncbi:MAG: sigma-70 family RNA polymerase sigma factor [Bacteroidetes bacterium]|nr:sigma-70 family RNA polymerase sigma factor [Bacteroidota bacterium]MCL5737937.1 sigma-70 family RNA polymerase sigma factor [Bacteroidota bacterium]